MAAYRATVDRRVSTPDSKRVIVPATLGQPDLGGGVISVFFVKADTARSTWLLAPRRRRALVGRPGAAGADLVDLAAKMPSDSQPADLHVLHRGKDLVAVARTRGTRREVANPASRPRPCDRNATAGAEAAAPGLGGLTGGSRPTRLPDCGWGLVRGIGRAPA
jgi:hypothetical protein